MRLTEREHYFYIIRLKLESLSEITLYKQLRKLFADKYEAAEITILSR